MTVPAYCDSLLLTTTTTTTTTINVLLHLNEKNTKLNEVRVLAA